MTNIATRWMETVMDLATCDIMKAYFEATGKRVFHGKIENFCTCGGTVKYTIVSGNLHIHAICDTCKRGFME